VTAPGTAPGRLPETPLVEVLARRIQAEGPLTVAAFMAECLLHPSHGYYATRDPFGSAGDFVTAPEVSQMFGELLGLCLAQGWLDGGAPAPVVLAELGPGRGTLMADLLRATRGVPGFHAALSVHFVEASPTLRRLQAERVPGATFHDTAATLPEGPLLLVANEFLDALPIRQAVRRGFGWAERVVGLEEGRLAWGLAPPTRIAELAHRLADTREGDVVEWCPALPGIVGEVGARVARHGGLALFVDYGGWRSLGDTLQAVRRHRPADPLEAPGEADLTAHVDFEAVARAAAPARATAPCPQGEFLRRLGIEARAERLGRSLSGARLDAHRARPGALDPARGNGDPVQGHGPPSPLCRAAAGARPPSGPRVVRLDVITSPLLEGVRHGFFGRAGGASSGVFAGLNCGQGSTDQAEAVTINRARVAEAIGVAPSHLVGVHQVHSAEAVVVTAPVVPRPRADGMATATPGLALSILTADCQPVLLADREAGVIGAAHAGWRGTVAGIIEATLAAMVSLGAEPGRVRAAIGPTISQRAYEVGPELMEEVLAEDPEAARFFANGPGVSRGDRLMSTCRATASCACGAPGWRPSGRGTAPTRRPSASSPIAARCTRGRPITGG
jgi:YfiH family protein